MESTSTVVGPPASGQATPTRQAESRQTESSHPVLDTSGLSWEVRDSLKKLKLSMVRDRMAASSAQPRSPARPLIPARPRIPARPVHCGTKDQETSRDVTVPAPASPVIYPVSEDAMPSSMLPSEPVPESDLVPEETHNRQPADFPRQVSSYADRLPKGWDSNMRKADQRWVGRDVFESKGHLADPSKHWHHPPQKRAIKKPVPGEFFLQRLFVWAPRMAYKFDFKCPGCSRSL